MLAPSQTPRAAGEWQEGYTTFLNPDYEVETGKFGPLAGMRISLLFPTNGVTLLPVHRLVLKRASGLFLNPAAVIEVYAVTDRSGSDDVNLKVSGQRLAQAEFALEDMGVPQSKLYGPNTKCFGEDYAADAHYDDGSREHRLRASIIYVWNGVLSSQTVFSGRRFLQYARSHKQK